jgi:hypothetical protein
MPKLYFGATAAVALALAACGPKAAAPGAASVAPSSTTLAGGPVEPTPPATKPVFPQWLEIARQAGGGAVQYHPASIQRDPKTKIADMWIQIIYSEPHTFVVNHPTAVEKITYQIERFLYRIDCEGARFAIMDRRIMGEGETVAQDIPTSTKPGETPWQDIEQGGVAEVAYDPACKAIIAAP